MLGKIVFFYRIKVLMTRNIFLRKYLAYHIYKPMQMDKKISKNLKLDFFRALKGSYFVLKVLLSRGLLTSWRVTT